MLRVLCDFFMRHAIQATFVCEGTLNYELRISNSLAGCVVKFIGYITLPILFVELVS